MSKIENSPTPAEPKREWPPRNPRRIDRSDEYRAAVTDAMQLFPEDPTFDEDQVDAWLAAHGWKPAEVDSEFASYILGHVLGDLTSLLVEETPTIPEEQ